MKKRIRAKHQHHEDVLLKKFRQQIEDEVKTKYVNRIDYLVGANNELMRELTLCEQELTHKDYISIPNKVADNIVLEENF